MARRAQAKVEEVAPKTLPDDFDLWDGGDAPPATLPKDFDDFDEAQAPQVRPSAPRADVAAPGKVAELPMHRMSAASPVQTTPAPAPISPPAPKLTRESSIKRGPARSNSLSIYDRTADEAPAAQPAKYVSTEELSTLVQAFHATQDEEFDEENHRKKNRMIRWIGVVVLVLAIVAVVVVLKLRKPTQQSQGVVVVQHPVVTYTPDSIPVKEKPSPAKPAQSATETNAPAPQP